MTLKRISPTMDPTIGGSGQASLSAWLSQFEDDEDLYLRAEQQAADRAELISGDATGDQTRQRQPVNEDNEPHREPQGSFSWRAVEQEAYSDWLASRGAGSDLHKLPNGFIDNGRSPTNGNNHQRQGGASDDNSGLSDNESSSGLERPTNEAARGHGGELRSSGKQQAKGRPMEADDPHQHPRMIRMEMDSAPSWSPLASWRLAKLVHKIAPELNCYTGSGEHYRGKVSTSSDLLPCLNWSHVRQLLSAARYAAAGDNSTATIALPAPTSAKLAEQQGDSPPREHNYCRNPNSDPRGPWCFVLANKRTVSGQDGVAAIARAPCNIPACSEYLWLYIVAPPLGLLLLLSCLLTILFMSIRRANYNSVFAHHQHRDRKPTSLESTRTTTHSSGAATKSPCSSSSVKKSSSGALARLIQTQAGRLLPFGLASKSQRAKRRRAKRKKNDGSFLEPDDVFEIVDDIDWSDGSTVGGGSGGSATSQQMLVHSQSFSPKSGESMRLNHSSPLTIKTTSTASAPQRPTLNHCQSINPIFNGKNLDLPSPVNSKCSSPAAESQLATSFQRHATSSNGPVFATLRCHVRGTLQGKRRLMDQSKLQLNGQNGDKSISILDRCDLATNSWSQKQQPDGLISYNSSSNSCDQANDGQQERFLNGERSIVASGLPQLDANSVSILYDLQPIFEGKFSQVQMAYMKQQQDDSTQATGMIGAQVAVCCLKQQAATFEQLFVAENLRLRNLNHLNLLKLIGHIQLDADANNDLDQSIENKRRSPCALVYDMAHLMDLSDWLREQNKESVSDEMSKDSSSLRQNLTCFAKQVALALDYLHDRNIVYKDLACRNCFLDVTKMLVKLASFNIELGPHEVEGEDSELQYSKSTNKDNSIQRSSLKSMIRPKYLLDYYVIDSRPSECQLLPLSWIPLESILFNKFNKQTDIWSFGCLLYELFSLGKVAYFGYSSNQVIDSVRSNLMPPQPLLCPNGIYKLMCKCLSDIPTLRPNVKHVYEQLNLYSGQCSSFLDHHLCSLATAMCNTSNSNPVQQNSAPKRHQQLSIGAGSMTKTKSYANIVTKSSNTNQTNNQLIASDGYDVPISGGGHCESSQPTTIGAKIPLSKSINLGSSKFADSASLLVITKQSDRNAYDVPILDFKND